MFKKLILVLEFLLLSITLSSQTVGWVYSVSKDGKDTHKECQSFDITDDNVVIFVVSGTSYQTFYQVGSDPKGRSIWADGANNKIVTRVVQADGTVVFWKSDKKAYYYRPGK